MDIFKKEFWDKNNDIFNHLFIGTNDYNKDIKYLQDILSEKFKEYYYANHEHRKQNSRAYAEINKEKIRERNKVRIICDSCGKEYYKRDKGKHNITKFHQASLKIIS